MTTLAAGLAAIAPAAAASAQAMMAVPIGSNPKPVPIQPPADAKDTPESIAKDSARDLNPSQMYNRLGATRADYDKDWQECRLIARGSRTPAGSIPYYYNPAVISPLAAGIGGGIGGLIAGAIIEGQQRRANRRSCLMIRGWRSVELPAATTTSLTAMNEQARNAWFAGRIGAANVEGSVTARSDFTLPLNPQAQTDAIASQAVYFPGKNVDPRAALVLKPNEAVAVMAFRRPGDALGRNGQLDIKRYDPVTRDLIYRPRNWKKVGDTTVYEVTAIGRMKKSPMEVQAVVLTAGDYVIAAASPFGVLATNSNCFGAPTFHVAAGEVVYLGEFAPVFNAQMADGRHSGMAWFSKPADAQRVLAASQPGLAAAMKPAALRNGATYACSAVTMDRWDLPGIASVENQASATSGTAN